MWYVFRLLFIVPVIGIIAVVIYADLYVFFRNRRGKPGVPRALAEFILIGWVCMFVYVTQIMSFGGISAGPNFVPFGDFVTAFRYGSNNAHLVWQFLLNIIMMVPLGLLIPIVFPKKMRGFTGVTAVAFCASLATEVLQIFTGRGSDIDDLIANTLGGVCGFALWAILYTAANYALKRPSMRFARQAVIGLIILCLTAAPFIAVSIADGSSEFGNFYYGNTIPTTVTVPDSISRESSMGRIYRATEHNSLETTQAMLKSTLGLNGDFSVVPYSQNAFELAEDTHLILINGNQYNTWIINFHHGEGTETDTSLLPEESEALSIVWARLSDYGITADNVRYNGLIEGYGDKNLHLGFKSVEGTDLQMVYGNVAVTVGEGGELHSISDQRIWCDFVKEVPCISPYEATQTAQKVGVGDWAGTAEVYAVEGGYSLINETGYVVPTWSIAARFMADSGNQYEWTPIIEAVR